MKRNWDLRSYKSNFHCNNCIWTKQFYGPKINFLDLNDTFGLGTKTWPFSASFTQEERVHYSSHPSRASPKRALERTHRQNSCKDREQIDHQPRLALRYSCPSETNTPNISSDHLFTCLLTGALQTETSSTQSFYEKHRNAFIHPVAALPWLPSANKCQEKWPKFTSESPGNTRDVVGDEGKAARVSTTNVRGTSPSVLAPYQSTRRIWHEGMRAFWLTRSEAPVLWVYVFMCLLVALCVGARSGMTRLYSGWMLWRLGSTTNGPWVWGVQIQYWAC